MREGIIVCLLTIALVLGYEHETLRAVTAAEWRFLQLVFVCAETELLSPSVCGSLRQSKVANLQVCVCVCVCVCVIAFPSRCIPSVIRDEILSRIRLA
jgi:hypothetical protein